MGWEWLGGRKLVLAGGEFAWLWLAIGLVALVLLYILYRSERALVSRQAGLGLLALRVLAALALIVALFEPIAARTFREPAKGRVILAVDVSESMSTTDPSRTQDAQQALAKSLKLSSPGQVEILSRLEVARRLMTTEGPLAKLADDHEIEAVAFARDTVETPLPLLSESLAKPTSHENASATDINAALRRALNGGETPVQGMILVTDGRVNQPVDASLVDRLAARGVPTFGVLIGSTIPPKDVAVAKLKGPDSVFVGDGATIEATIKLDGISDGEKVVVTLNRAGSEPITQTVSPTTDGSRPVASFRVPLESKGHVALTVAVTPPTGDLRADNNSQTIVVQVADDQARVLIVDGEARWEFRYLRNALTRDPRVKVDVIVLHQPMSSLSPETTYGGGLPPRAADPSVADPLGTYDLIILGDIDPADFNADAWQRLDAYVADRGGTLVISPGPRFWPTGHTTSAKVRALLPIVNPTVTPYDMASIDPARPALPPGIRLAPSREALAELSNWPMLQIGPDPSTLWSELPKQPWTLGGRIKPGASVLVSQEGATKPDEAAIIATQPFGLGKVLWVGTDSTWRWRFGVGDTYHHAFWGQVVRWAASGGLSGGNRFVRFGLLKSRVVEDEGAKLQARFAEGITGVGPDLLVVAKVFPANHVDSEPVSVVALHPLAGQPRAFEGLTPNLPAGSYILKLDAPDIADQLTMDGKEVEAQFEVLARETSERVELAASRDTLDQLANATGGQVFADHEAGKLSEILKSKIKVVERTVETPLWDGPGALLFFFGVLSVEWIMRKRFGLP